MALSETSRRILPKFRIKHFCTPGMVQAMVMVHGGVPILVLRCFCGIYDSALVLEGEERMITIGGDLKLVVETHILSLGSKYIPRGS